MTGGPFSLYRRKESGAYYAQFRLPSGKWSNARSTRQYKKRDALAWCEDYLRQHGQPVSKNRITFKDFTIGFFDEGGIWERNIDAHQGSVTGTHRKNQQGRLNNYLLPMFGDWKLDEIGPGDIDRALLHIKATAKPGQGSKNDCLSNRTVNSLHSCLSAIFSEAVRAGYMARNPMKEVPRLRDNQEDRGILTIAELQKLINPETATGVWRHPRYYLMFLIAISTAARSGEIRTLHPEDVQDDHLILRRSIDDVDGERNTTKTGTHRTVPLTPEIHDSLVRWIKKNKVQYGDYIFPSPTKPEEPIDRDSLLKNFRQSLKRIGIKIEKQKERNLVYHSLRHAAATLAVADGVNPWVVRQMTGHKSEKVFQKYIDHASVADWSALSEWQKRLVEKVS